MFAPTFTATLQIVGTPLIEAVVVAAAALACGIVVRLLVDARTPTITLRVVTRANVPRAA